MSVIQKIRDKYARVAVIAIAISLLGFILMDAFAGKPGMMNDGPGSTIGRVDGNKIDRIEFDKKVKDIEMRQGGELTDDLRQQILDEVWRQEVEDIILTKEYEKLGLTITEKELNESLFGKNPPQFITQAFSDPNTGAFDAIKAKQQLPQLLKSGSVQQKEYLNANIEAFKKQKLLGKYMALLINSINMPKWFLEKLNADNSLMAKFSYVNIPYTSISDSAVKISDEEIMDYMKKNKEMYEQKGETRSITYVTFNASATSGDSAAIRSDLDTLIPAFKAATNNTTFLTQKNSRLKFEDAYFSKSRIVHAAKDSIFALPVGGIYGPYLDAPNYVVAKLVDMKIMPDSAKVRHILIQTQDPRSQQQFLTDSVAKARIDSIRLALGNGVSFDSLAKKYSADESSAGTGGLVQDRNPQTGEIMSDYFGQGRMVKAFNDSVFSGKVGKRMVVKTEFGYHLIDILDLKNIEPHYKVAYLARKIIPSPSTNRNAQNQANSFAGDSRTLKAFNDNWEKNLRTKGITKSPAIDIKPLDYSFGGLTSARAFVRKVFEADKGDIIGPEKVGENYVVAVVTEVNKTGYKSLQMTRSAIEPALMNKKKAEQIIKNLGKITTLEEVAARQKPVQQVMPMDSVKFGQGSRLGQEPRVLGAVFNPANKGKVVTEPIIGQAGIFILRVENLSTVPVPAANVEEQRKNYESSMKQSIIQQLQQRVNPIVETLKRIADIKDNRGEFY